MALSRLFRPYFMLEQLELEDLWDSFYYCTPYYCTSLLHKHFGYGLLESDLLPPVMFRGYRLRPRAEAFKQSSGQSEAKNDKGKFKVFLDVTKYGRDELEVKVVDNHVVVHGKQEERTDEHGFIITSREFTRRYMLPEGTDPETIKSSLSLNGILTIEALPSNERVIRIKTSV